MFSSCSQPIKANKIIPCRTLFSSLGGTSVPGGADGCAQARYFQHSIRTARTRRWRLTISIHVRRPYELRTCSWDFQHSIRTAASKRRQLTTRQSPLVSAVRANCLTNGCEFALRGVRNSRFSTFSQNSINKETTTYDLSIFTRVRRPCELLANCEFGLRGSVSFRSEPNETNILNGCNVKWTVYNTNTRPIHINCNRASKIV